MQVRIIYADRNQGAIERFRRRCAELADTEMTRLSPPDAGWGTLEGKNSRETRQKDAPEDPT
ncbi:MAG TPA: hypothetical protein VK464_19200 [Symbiobacteriaceae bacterium]|nr:hypothetical protein [Symbiobacteriaceae bacterium]